MIMKKLLSICIPTYNRYYYVSKLVDHILAFNKELFRDIDIIVSDNSSTDETQSFFVELTRKKISHLKYHRNDINIGATKNLEQVKNLAKSRYVWWLGDDDWIEENNATQVLEKLREQECSILLLDRCVVFSDREKEESLFSHYFAKSVSFTTNEMLSYVGPLTALGCISNIIFSKEKLTNVVSFERFCKFETSHPHVGYLLANLCNQKCYIDLENKITTYAMRQVPEEYEFNHNKNSHKDIISRLVCSLPNMYSFLVKKGYVKKQNLLLGKEFVWGYSKLLFVEVHANFLLLISIIRQTISDSELLEVEKKYLYLYGAFFPNTPFAKLMLLLRRFLMVGPKKAFNKKPLALVKIKKGFLNRMFFVMFLFYNFWYKKTRHLNEL